MNRTDHAASPRWQSGLAELIVACPNAGAGEEPRLLREGYAAIRDAAAFDPMLTGHLPSTAEFEAMLSCGAPESAAIALIPNRGGFMLSRSEDGNHIGSIFMLKSGEHTAEGNTAALALLAATLSAYHAMLGQRDPELLLN